MSKSRKKKQQQREDRRQKPQPMYGNAGDVLIFSEENGHVGIATDGAIHPRPAVGLKRALLETVIFSAKHLGAFNEQMADKVRKGQTKALYVDVPSLVDDLDRMFRDYHPEPRRTPADNAPATMANDRSEFVPAIPEPLYGLKKACSCGRSFWRLQNYRAHYAHDHIVMGTQPL